MNRKVNAAYIKNKIGGKVPGSSQTLNLILLPGYNASRSILIDHSFPDRKCPHTADAFFCYQNFIRKERRKRVDGGYKKLRLKNGDVFAPILAERKKGMKPYFSNLCDKLFEILEDQNTPMRIRKLRSDALLQLWRYAEKLERTISIRKDLFDITFGKKSEFIMSATTAKEVKEILKPSIPKWSCGQWYTSPYHVEEEELIYWATFTPHHNPGPEAIQRYITVFDRYYRANPS